ncbi:MAG: hypothetical protein DWQ06_07465 [Calditrichaeota bacterium]|nr:MAG: hypothetical protein DWQ06_07465 [Calditrichota bacterium]
MKKVEKKDNVILKVVSFSDDYYECTLEATNRPQRPRSLKLEKSLSGRTDFIKIVKNEMVFLYFEDLLDADIFWSLELGIDKIVGGLYDIPKWKLKNLSVGEVFLKTHKRAYAGTIPKYRDKWKGYVRYLENEKLRYNNEFGDGFFTYRYFVYLTDRFGLRESLVEGDSDKLVNLRSALGEMKLTKKQKIELEKIDRDLAGTFNEKLLTDFENRYSGEIRNWWGNGYSRKITKKALRYYFNIAKNLKEGEVAERFEEKEFNFSFAFYRANLDEDWENLSEEEIEEIEITDENVRKMIDKNSFAELEDYFEGYYDIKKWWRKGKRRAKKKKIARNTDSYTYLGIEVF